jgi:hypothetical protein
MNTNTWDTEKYCNVSGEQRGVSTACYTGAAQEHGGDLGGLTTGSTSQAQMYMSWWFKPAASVTAGTNGASKFLRFSTSTYPEDAGRETFSWAMVAAYVYNDGLYGPPLGSGFYVENYTTAGNWTFMEAIFDNVNKTFALYQNAALCKQSDWSNAGSFNFNVVWKVGYEPGGETPDSVAHWMDDIYVDSSFSRVMVCSGSTWSTRSHCEMQIPSSWSSSSIAVTVNRGSFAAGASAYLYVIDSTGVSNSSGYPITFGSSGGPTTYTESVTKAGTGTGTVTSADGYIDCGSSCSYAYASGSSTLSASAGSGSTFAGWSSGSGDMSACTGTGTCAYTVSAAGSVTATFNTTSAATSYAPWVH